MTERWAEVPGWPGFVASDRGRQRADDRRHGVRLGPKKLTSPRVRALRRMATLGLSTRQIGCRLGVSHTSVRKVLSGERFSHV